MDCRSRSRHARYSKADYEGTQLLFISGRATAVKEERRKRRVEAQEEEKEEEGPWSWRDITHC